MEHPSRWAAGHPTLGFLGDGAGPCWAGRREMTSWMRPERPDAGDAHGTGESRGRRVSFMAAALKFLAGEGY